MQLEIDFTVPTEPTGSYRRLLRGFIWVLGFTVGAICATSAQDSKDLQEQLQELKAQYEQSTQQMQQRITILERQIDLQSAKQAEIERQKSETVSAVELAAQRTEKSLLGQSDQAGGQFQGQIAQEPTYDFLQEAERRI